MAELAIRGVGFWSPGVASWAQARELIETGADWPDSVGGRAIPTLMPANERRRAPDGVLLALAVAEQACTDAGMDPRDLPSVFVSAYGDLAINDYMCASLAAPAPMLSPTKFHNSVHNAPSGYWSIATGSTTPTTALAGYRDSFAAGLLEAATQVAETGGAMLLVAYDIAGVGPMIEVTGCSAPFGCALILDSTADAAGEFLTRLRLAVISGNATPSRADSAGLAGLASANPIAQGAGALLQALTTKSAQRIILPLTPGLDLALQVQP
jgi:hypothetical protein